ncbi:MAG: hypothetical protein KIT69_09380, partial [Propionibacteriaceae bacterium]|nr:hypothetical protein [Propionibacteriaceae bacterium]
IKVTAPHLTPLRGFLGSPDGNPANDRDGADGTSHDAFGAYGDGRAALLDFGASWRITDPAATPLSEQSSDYFNAKTPDEIDPAELALAEQQVRDRLPALLPPLCTVTSVSDYTIAALALEHWAFPDMGLDATIARWTSMLCSYAVSGTVSASLNGDTQVVAGLAVTVDLPGAASCTATTGTNGRYACTLRPLTPTEAGGFTPPASGGPTATVTVSRPDGDPVGTGSASFDELATQGLTLSAIGDVSVDPSVLRAVILHGTLVRDGAPMVGPLTLPVHLYNGSIYGGQRDVVVSPDADGSYSATLLLQQATKSIGVDLSRSTSFRTVPYNSPNWQVKDTGMTDAAFDWDDTGYKLVFGGTVSQALLDAGAAGTTLKIKASVVRLDGSAYLVDVYTRSLSCADEQTYTTPIRLTDCFDGTSFGGEITLPAPATSVEVLVSSPALTQPQLLRFDVKPGANPLVLFGQGGDGVRAASVLITGVTAQVRDDYNFPWDVVMIQSDHSREWGFGYSVRPWEQFGWDTAVTGVEYVWYPRPGTTSVGVELNGSIFGTGTRAEVPLDGVTSWPVRVATYDLTARDWDDQSVLVRFESYSRVWAKDTRVTVTGLVDGEPRSDPVEIFYDDNTDHRTRVIGTAWVSNNDSRFDGWFAFPAGTNGVRVETVDERTGASATVDHGIDEVIDPLAFHILTVEANLVTSAGPIDLRLHARLLTETDDGDVEWWSGNVTVTNGELNLAVLAPLDLAGWNDRIRLVLWPGYGDEEWIWFSPPADEAQRRAVGGSYSVSDEWADAPSYEMSFEQTLSSALRETEWEHAVVTVTGDDGERLARWKLTDPDDYGADSEYTEGDVGDWQAGDRSGDWTLPELTLRQRVWVPRVVSTVHVEISFPESDHDHTLERDVSVTDGGIVQLADIASYLLDIEAGLAGGGSYPGPWVAGFAFPLNPEPTDPDEDRMWRQRVEIPAGTDRVLLVGWLPRKPKLQVVEAWVEWTEHSSGSGASWEVELDADVAGYGAGLRLEYTEPQGRAASSDDPAPTQRRAAAVPDSSDPESSVGETTQPSAEPTPEPEAKPEPEPSAAPGPEDGKEGPKPEPSTPAKEPEPDPEPADSP